MTKTKTKPAAPSTSTKHGKRERGGHVSLGAVLCSPFVGPWLLAYVLVPAAAEAFWLLWGSSPWRLAIAAGGVAIGAGGGAFTWHEAAPRGVFTQARAAATVACLFSTIGLGTLHGFVRWVGHGSHGHLEFVRPWADLHALLAFVLCVSWNVRRAEAIRGDGTDAHPQQEDKSPLAETLGLKRTPAIKKSTTSEDGIRHELVLRHPGDTTADVQHGLPTLVSELGIPATGARAIPSPDRADETTLVLVTQDVLKTPRTWPGPSRPGGSVAEPSCLGVYEDGQPLELVRPGQPGKRNAVSILVMGMTGAGKTEGVLLEVAELVTRVDVVLWWVDVVKGAQTADDILPAIDWLATNTREAMAMVKAIKHLVAYRAAALKSIGLREWTPEAWKRLEMPFLIIHIEEFAAVAEAFDKDIIRAGEAVRSVGISLSVSLQRASANNMSTDLRANLGVGFCFGVKEAVDASMCLSESTTGAGAVPETWMNKRPGMAYLEASHVDENAWSTPARTFYPPAPAVLRQHVATWAPRMAALDPGSAKHAGPAYAARDVVTLEQWAEAHDDDRTGEEFTVEEPDDVDALTFDEDRDEARAELAEQRDPEVADELAATDPRVSIPADDAGDFALGDESPGRAMSPEERNKALLGVLRKFFEQEGDPEHVDVKTSDLVDAWEATGVYGTLPDGSPANLRPALSDRLQRLERDGHAERVARARGNKSATWRIYASVFTGPPATDSEPAAVA